MKFRRLGARAALFAVQNKKVFKERLNAGVERNVLRSVGILHACGAATENALSPSLRRVLGTTKFPFIASRSAGRDEHRRRQSGDFSYTLALDRRSTCRQAGTVCTRFVEQSADNGAP